MLERLVASAKYGIAARASPDWALNMRNLPVPAACAAWIRRDSRRWPAPRTSSRRGRLPLGEHIW